MIKVGISQRVYLCPRTNEIRDCIDRRWYDFFELLNIILIPIPNSNIVESLFYNVEFDGFILSGGNNLNNKKNYSEEKMLKFYDISATRDVVEEKIIDFCLKKNVPLIGVCRGMQMINSYFGGSLMKVNPKEHVSVNHKVFFENSIFCDFYGPFQTLNSFHNFGVSDLTIAEELIPLGNSGNSIECLKHKFKDIYGIMWHPERYKTFQNEDINLFKEIFKNK